MGRPPCTKSCARGGGVAQNFVPRPPQFPRKNTRCTKSCATPPPLHNFFASAYGPARIGGSMRRDVPRRAHKHVQQSLPGQRATNVGRQPRLHGWRTQRGFLHASRQTQFQVALKRVLPSRARPPSAEAISSRDPLYRDEDWPGQSKPGEQTARPASCNWLHRGKEAAWSTHGPVLKYRKTNAKHQQGNLRGYDATYLAACRIHIPNQQGNDCHHHREPFVP